MAREKIIILKYKNEEKEMRFLPYKFSDLTDYFLTLFNKKSNQRYSFFAYINPDPEEKIILIEQDFNNNFSKLTKLKRPVIFIEDYIDDYDEEYNRDVENIKYIIDNKIKFEKDYSNYEEELKKKTEIIKDLERRITDLEKEVNDLKNRPNNEDLIKSNEEYKKKNLELIKKINSLKK